MTPKLRRATIAAHFFRDARAIATAAWRLRPRAIRRRRIGSAIFASRIIRISRFRRGSNHVEAWIPLPREDQFQRITSLEVNTPVHHEIVDQNHNGNRLLHLDASAPLPASIPVTVSFEVKRIEEAPNLERAQRNVPEPTGGKFAEFLGPDKLVPLDGRIAQVSNKLGDETASPWQQAQIIYEYVVGVMSYDKTGKGWGRGDAHLRMRCAARQLHRFPFAVHRAGALARNPGALHDWVSDRQSEIRRGSRLSLLGGVLLRRRMGSGRCVRGVEESRAPRILLRASRCGACRVHDGPRPEADSAPARRAAQLSHLSVCRGGRKAAAEGIDQESFRVRGQRELARHQKNEQRLQGSASWRRAVCSRRRRYAGAL